MLSLLSVEELELAMTAAYGGRDKWMCIVEGGKALPKP
jgi:hypothetical protein